MQFLLAFAGICGHTYQVDLAGTLRLVQRQ